MPKSDGQWVAQLELRGTVRVRALAQANRELKRWGLTMPVAKPIANHFGLQDFMRIGLIEYWIVNDRRNRYCGKFLFLFQNQRCPRHYHPVKDETFFIVRGKVEMEAGRRIFTMPAGDTYKMAPGVKHTFRAVGGPALILEVSLPSLKNDNIFDDRRIGKNGVI